MLGEALRERRRFSRPDPACSEDMRPFWLLRLNALKLVRPADWRESRPALAADHPRKSHRRNRLLHRQNTEVGVFSAVLT